MTEFDWAGLWEGAYSAWDDTTPNPNYVRAGDQAAAAYLRERIEAAFVPRAEAAEARVKVLEMAGKRLLQYEGHMVYCGHSDDMDKPCVCGLIKAQDDFRAALGGEHGK